MLSAFPFFSDFFLSLSMGCTIVLLAIVEIECLSTHFHYHFFFLAKNFHYHLSETNCVVNYCFNY